MSREQESVLAKMSRQCIEDSDRWFGDSHVAKSIPHHTLAMAGEVGEFANIVKKIERGSLSMQDPAVRVRLAMELTDIFTYLLNLAGLIGIDLEKSYVHVRTENQRRFTAERNKRESGS